MGISAVSGSERSSRANSRPSFPGSWRSIRIRSGRISASMPCASSAECASSVVNPARSRTVLVNSMLAWLSSTTSTNGASCSDSNTIGLQLACGLVDELVHPAKQLHASHRVLLEDGGYATVEHGFLGVSQLLGGQDKDGNRPGFWVGL